MNQLYCISHEEVFTASHDVFWGLSHTSVERVATDLWGSETDYDIVMCDFPMGFAYCAPPVFENVTLPEREPYQEELEAAEQGALEFMLAMEEA